MTPIPVGRSRRHRKAPLFVAAALTVAAAVPAVVGRTEALAATTTAQVSSWPSQTIQGIGASGAWWPNDLIHFSPANQQAVANLLFGPSGIQLSTYRYNIGGGGVGVTAADRAPQSLQTSVGSYDWKRIWGGTAFLTYAAWAGVPNLIGFVNSAPTAFTSNAQNCGGSLNSGAEPAFGTYLADIVAHFASLGVAINYLSPINEPDSSFSNCGQEGMAVPPSQRAAVVKALGAALSSRGLSAGITADESSKSNQVLSAWPTWLNVSGTTPYVAALAHHTYDWPGDATMTNIQSLGRRYGKQTWASEICCYTSLSGGYGAQYDPTIVGALPLANAIYRDFAIANDTQFHWWTALSKVIGCSPGTNSTCATTVNNTGWNDGLVYYDPNYATNGNQSLYLTKRYYVLGQYSKFVRPGAVRFPVTGAPSGVSVLATSNNGSWTLVVNNTGTGSQSFDVHFNALNTIAASAAYRTSATENLASISLPAVAGGTASLTVPAQSVTTYVFGQYGGSAIKSGGSPFVGTQSGKCLDVVGASSADGTGIELRTCSGAARQSLTYTAASELRVLGKCLDAAGQGTANATAIVLYGCNGGANQKWTLAANQEIRGVQSGRCLDATGQGTADGTLLVLYTCNNGTNQRWSRPN